MYPIAGASMALILAVILLGCQQPEMNMSKMMKPPPRPPELDRLDAFVGTWEVQAEVRMPGTDQTGSSKGVETVSWQAGRQFLLGRYEHEAGDAGTVSGVYVWTWDPEVKKYRLWSFDSFGNCCVGTGTYDETSGVWNFEQKGRNPGIGDTSSGKGTTRLIDERTQEWTWSDWDGSGRTKRLDLKGTSRRK